MADTSYATYTVEIAWSGNVQNPFTIGVSTLGGGAQLVGDFTVDFSGAYDNVSSDCDTIEIDRGRDDPLSTVQAGTCNLELLDLDGRYNPYNASSPLYGLMTPMRQVRVRATDSDGVVWPLFYGFIRDIDYDPKTYRSKISCEDVFLLMDRTRPIMDVTNSVTGAIVIQLLAECNWSNHDVSATEGDTVANFSLAGTSDSRSALQAVADLLESERGLFWVGPDGKVHYQDRHTLAVKPSTLSLSDVFLNVLPGASLDAIINRARVTKEGNTTQEFEDTVSVLQYGPSDIAIESPYFVDDAAALGLASFIVNARSNPNAPVWSLPMMANFDLAVLKACLGVDVGNRVTLTSTPGGFTGDFMVESVKHRIKSGVPHTTELALSKRAYGADGASELFIIGTSTLGGGNVLAYY